MRRISEPGRHAIASVLITMCLFGMACIVLILPAEQLEAANRERIEALEQKISAYRRADRKITALETEIEALESSDRNNELFITAATPALAAAELQRTLKTLIEQHQGHLISSQAVTRESDVLFPRITIKLNMRGNIKILQGVLYDIATARPRLSIDNLIIQRQRRASRRQEKTEPRLDARFDVIAYLDVTEQNRG